MKTEHFLSFLLAIAFSSSLMAGIAPLRYALQTDSASQTNEEKTAFWFEKENLEERSEKESGSETYHSGGSDVPPSGLNGTSHSYGLCREAFLNALQTKSLQSWKDHARQLLCISTHPPLYIFLCTFKGVLPG